MKSWFRKSSTHQDTTDLPLYKRRASFMREADHALFDCLQRVVGQAYHIFVKVKLSELVEPQVESGNRVHQLHWMKVQSQTIDFLLCRRHDRVPMVAVCVLPKTEYARRGISAQNVTDVVLRDIGLPKLTMPEKKDYDRDQLKKKLKIAMAESQDHSTRSPGKVRFNSVPN